MSGSASQTLKRKKAARRRARKLRIDAPKPPRSDIRVSQFNTDPIAAAPECAGRYEIVAAADGVAEILLYGFIGGWEGTNAEDFHGELQSVAADAKKVIVRINSGGGSVFEAVAIYNTLAGLSAEVETRVEGVAASAATLIAMAGDEIRICENAFFMVHEARGGTFGTAPQIRQYLDLLDRANQSILLTYAARTGIPEADLREYMAQDTWMTAAEALEAGFVDAIDPVKETKPHVPPKSRISAPEPSGEFRTDLASQQINQLLAQVMPDADEPEESMPKPAKTPENTPETPEPEAAKPIDEVAAQLQRAADLTAAFSDDPEFLQAAIFDPEMTVERAKLQRFDSVVDRLGQAEKRIDQLAKEGTTEQPEFLASDDDAEPVDADDADAVDASVKSEWNKHPELKEEFPSFNTFAAWRKRWPDEAL